MRAYEIINNTDAEQLDEGIREKLGAAALAAGLGLGGLGVYNYGDKNKISEPSATEIVKQTPKYNLSSMSPEQIETTVRKLTSNINWRPGEQQQFIAQAMHETHGFRNMVENLYYATPKRIYNIFTSSFRKNPQATKHYVNKPVELANLVYANRMGNGDVSSGDGWRYRGRGLLHITGKEMYDRVGRGIGVDLVSNPDLLATDLDISTRAALWYWQNIVSKKIQRQGKTAQDTLSVTKAINPAAAGLKSRQQKYQQELKKQAVEKSGKTSKSK